MPFAPAQLTAMKQLGDWLLRASPACLAVVLTSGISAYIYAGQTFATVESVEQLRMSITDGFGELSARMDLSDAEDRVKAAESAVLTLQQQVKSKEREAADLLMVVDEMEQPHGDSASILRSRAFQATQDLSILRDNLADAMRSRAEAIRNRDDIARRYRTVISR